MNASRVVLTEGALVVGVTAVASLHAGNGIPSPKVFIAGAAAYGALILLAGPAPKLAISLGALGVAYGILRSSGNGKSIGETVIGAITGAGGGAFPSPGSAGAAAAAAQAAQNQRTSSPAPASAGTQTGGVTGPVPLGKGGGAASWANSHLGIPYSWGGGTDAGPTLGIGEGASTIGFDCSSFVKAAWAAVGVKLPRITQDQQKVGVAIPTLADAAPGDLLFPTASCPGGVCQHVQMYLGNGKAVEEPHHGLTSRVIDVTGESLYTIRRPG